MKLGVRQDVLMKALSKGSASALTETAQTDTSNVSLLVKSIKITAGKNLVVESTTNLMASRYSIPATKENGIVITEEGVVLIPAKELIDWVKVQGPDSVINMSLAMLKAPEVINPMGDDNDTEFIVKRVGALKLLSKDETKTGIKWELDCYDPSEIKSVNFKDVGQKSFEVKVHQLKDAVKKISIASAPKDPEHLLDSMSVQEFENHIYLAATDTNRCAVYKLEEAQDVQHKGAFLVPLSLVNELIKISDDENTISFSYNIDSERLFVSQDNLEVRIATVDKNKASSFPLVSKLFTLSYKPLAVIPTQLLQKTLNSASIVNGVSALFEFVKQDGPNFSITTISETNKYKPNISKSHIEMPIRELKAVWGVKHMLDLLKVTKAESLNLMIPDSKRNVKLTMKDDDRFSYFAQVIDNPKYEDNQQQ